MSSTYKVSHVSAFPAKNWVFGPCDLKDGKFKVEVYRDGSSTTQSNRLNRANLCTDAMKPFPCNFGLDGVREDGNPERRGLMLRVTDPETVRALQEIDEVIVQKAVASSKEWFTKGGRGPVLSEEVVRSRYSPLIYKYNESDEHYVCKIKVKAGGRYPTVLHLMDDAGAYRKNAGRLEDLTPSAQVVPVVSMSWGIWFMAGGKFGITMQAEEIIIFQGQKQDDMSHFASSVPLTKAPEAARDETARDEAAGSSVAPTPMVKIEMLEDDGDDEGPL
jgi:hypothetical protein